MSDYERTLNYLSSHFCPISVALKLQKLQANAHYWSLSKSTEKQAVITWNNTVIVYKYNGWSVFFKIFSKDTLKHVEFHAELIEPTAKALQAIFLTQN